MGKTATRWAPTLPPVIAIALAVAASLSRGDETARPQITSDAAATPTAPLPKAVDLRPQLGRWGLDPRRQGERNTCSVLTTAGALEFAVSKHRGQGSRISPEYLNWACNQVIKNETEDRGQFFHDLLKAFDKYGACREADMPYQKKFDPQLKPSDVARKSALEIRAIGLKIHWINPWKPNPGLTDEQLQTIKHVLADGYPVAAGAQHSRLLVGYADNVNEAGGGIFHARDSGPGAFTKVTYEWVKTNVGDAFWIEPPTKSTQ